MVAALFSADSISLVAVRYFSVSNGICFSQEPAEQQLGLLLAVCQRAPSCRGVSQADQGHELTMSSNKQHLLRFEFSLGPR